MIRRPAATSMASLAVSLALAATAPARAEKRADVTPYLGLDQTVITDFEGGSGDTLSYTSVVVGVDAHLRGRNSEIQANLAYEHQFSWTRGEPDQDVISGLVRGRTGIAGNRLGIEGGVLATRVRTDGFTGANNSLAASGARSDVYSAYAGPTFQDRLGDLEVSAAYRLGYNRLEDGDASLTGTPFNSFDESWTHYATASVGMKPGALLPFGWAVAAGYEREDARQLDQRFEDKWARLDVTLPVSLSLALVGGVGYESIRISNRDALRDSAGDPQVDSSGRFVTDPGSPRLLSYDEDELIWDVGLLWRPSRRTSAELHVGHRYGSMSYTGGLSWQPDARSSLTINLYDSVDSFGRALSGSLANVPTNFVVHRNPFSGDLAGCAFGAQDGACFSDALSGMRAANFRHRRVTLTYTRRAGPWTIGAGAGYSRRKFIAHDALFSEINGVTDENWFATVALGYAFDDRSGVDLTIYANQFDSGVVGIADVFNAGAYASYHRQFSRRLQGVASIGLDRAEQSGVDGVLTGLAQIGVRYAL